MFSVAILLNAELRCLIVVSKILFKLVAVLILLWITKAEVRCSWR